MNDINRVMLADSYKYSHPEQFPENTVSMFDYMSSRGGGSLATVFIGLQYILMKYFSTPITKQEVDEARDFAELHGEPFAYDDWMYLVEHHKGKLPVEIKAVPEGSVIPINNVLFTIKSTDIRLFWIVGWLETVLLKTWYPISIATKSYEIKQMLKKFADKTGSNSAVEFQYHNFGDRGSSSAESAEIGGIAHLSQFMGTDNFHALKGAKKYYMGTMAGFSIPASEHSTVTSWGKEGRFKMYDNYIETFKDYPMIACVMDSYDIYEDVDYITSGTRIVKIESDDYPKFIIRPDSGDPIEVINKILDIMETNGVISIMNAKNYKVFKNYGILWGDGITKETIEKILESITARGYSSDNMAFGSGGDLMQNVNRDTHKFAIKCSSIDVDEGAPIDHGDGTSSWESFIVQRDVYKDPITDPGKSSLKGEVTLVKRNNEYKTIRIEDKQADDVVVLQPVFINGNMKSVYSLDSIRRRSNV